MSKPSQSRKGGNTKNLCFPEGQIMLRFQANRTSDSNAALGQNGFQIRKQRWDIYYILRTRITKYQYCQYQYPDNSFINSHAPSYNSRTPSITINLHSTLFQQHHLVRLPEVSRLRLQARLQTVEVDATGQPIHLIHCVHPNR